MTTYEKLERIEKHLSELINLLKPEQKNECEVDERCDDITKTRLLFVTIGLIASALYTYLMFLWYLPLFSISFGFFIAFGMLAFVLLFDAYILPGNTLRRISNNAIASAITILAFVIIVVSGAQIGNSLITNPYSSEEYRQPQTREIIVPISSSPAIGDGVQGDTGSPDREQ